MLARSEVSRPDPARIVALAAPILLVACVHTHDAANATRCPAPWRAPRTAPGDSVPDPLAEQMLPLPTANREERIQILLDLAHRRATGRDDAQVAAVTIDRDAGIVRVIANRRGFEQVVVALGGCVLYPDPPRDRWSIRVVYLQRRSADVAALWLGRRAGTLARVVADSTTNSVVITAPPEVVDQFAYLIEAWDADCLVGVSVD